MPHQKRLWLLSTLLSKGPVTSHMAHWVVCETETEAREHVAESILRHKPGFKVDDMPPAIVVPEHALRLALGLDD